MKNLFLISTPIGNLNDISKRSLNLFQDVDFIFCENTTNSKKLFKLLEINTVNKKFISLHKFNEISSIKNSINIIENNDSILISDAGTPTISDPGQWLVKEIRDKKIANIIPVPGATSIIAALSASGIIFKSFSFLGFLPKKENEILKTLLGNKTEVLIFFESPLRIKKTLSFIKTEFGNIDVTIARELTKKFEEISKIDIKTHLEKEYKGEMVILIETKYLIKNNLKKYINLLNIELLSNKDKVDILTNLTNYSKNEIYNELKLIKK